VSRRVCNVSARHALDEVLAAVAAAMRDFAARWYLFGAQAASPWGRPRLTADEQALGQSDLLVVLETELARLG